MICFVVFGEFYYLVLQFYSDNKNKYFHKFLFHRASVGTKCKVEKFEYFTA